MYKTTLSIDGMVCSMCESHLNDCVRKNFNIIKVTSSHKKGITEIISDMPLEEDPLRNTINATGYRIESITVEPYEKKKKRFLFF